jgi:hypothetical protein
LLDVGATDDETIEEFPNLLLKALIVVPVDEAAGRGPVPAIVSPSPRVNDLTFSRT